MGVKISVQINKGHLKYQKVAQNLDPIFASENKKGRYDYFIVLIQVEFSKMVSNCQSLADCYNYDQVYTEKHLEVLFLKHVCALQMDPISSGF